MTIIKPEVHLFIIWSNARYREGEIISDIASRFTILGWHEVTWSVDHFSTNLTRFYGENLPANSNKERLCGNGPFTLVVVLDRFPLYRTRMTSKGPKVVNVNMFDSKEMYRQWTGGGHMIHGTNTDAEVRHDLVLLTGCSKKDYMIRAEKTGTMLMDSFGSMPGEDSWKDMSQLLYVLNETVDYVVLRNYDDLFSNYNETVHGDVDILASNRYLAKLAMNAKPVYRSKRRVKHIVNIGQGGTYFDIRYVGDDYYCRSWEENILANRNLTTKGYYVTNDENYAYSLLYHALVQKPSIAEDYRETFNSIFPRQTDEQLRETLLAYLKEHNYSMIEPYDYTVYFNEKLTGKRMSITKLAHKVLNRIVK